MEIPAILKNKWVLLGIVAGIGIALYSRNGSTQSPTLSNASIMGYDKDLIMMGQQTALEREKLQSSLEMAQIASSTELAGRYADNETALGMMTLSTGVETLSLNNQLAGLNSQLDYERYNTGESSALARYLSDSAERIDMYTTGESSALTRYLTDSAERKYGTDAAIRNTELSVQQNLGLWANQTQQVQAQQNAYATVESSRLAADSAVKAAKASKSKSIGCCGFSLSI